MCVLSSATLGTRLQLRQRSNQQEWFCCSADLTCLSQDLSSVSGWVWIVLSALGIRRVKPTCRYHSWLDTASHCSYADAAFDNFGLCGRADFVVLLRNNWRLPTLPPWSSRPQLSSLPDHRTPPTCAANLNPQPDSLHNEYLSYFNYIALRASYYEPSAILTNPIRFLAQFCSSLPYSTATASCNGTPQRRSNTGSDPLYSRRRTGVNMFYGPPHVICDRNEGMARRASQLRTNRLCVAPSSLPSASDSHLQPISGSPTGGLQAMALTNTSSSRPPPYRLDVRESPGTCRALPSSATGTSTLGRGLA